MQEEEKKQEGQEAASGQEAATTPVSAPPVDYAKKLEETQSELKALQDARSKLEHDYNSLKGTLAERLDTKRELASIRREMQENRDYTAALLEAQATGEPEKIASVKASWVTRDQQRASMSDAEQEATEIYQDIVSEAKSMGITLSSNSPPPEELAEVAVLWNEGFNTDPSKLRIGSLRKALRVAREKARSHQEKTLAEEKARLKKESEDELRKAKKEAGLLDTPNPPPAAGRGKVDFDTLADKDTRGMSLKELQEHEQQLKEAQYT